MTLAPRLASLISLPPPLWSLQVAAAAITLSAAVVGWLRQQTSKTSPARH